MVQIPAPLVAHTGGVRVRIPHPNRQSQKDSRSGEGSDFKERASSYGTVPKSASSKLENFKLKVIN
jgi:hypothetical protein